MKVTRVIYPRQGVMHPEPKGAADRREDANVRIPKDTWIQCPKMRSPKSDEGEFV